MERISTHFSSLALPAVACDRNCIILATTFHMVFLNSAAPHLKSASKPRDFLVLYKLLCNKPETFIQEMGCKEAFAALKWLNNSTIYSDSTYFRPTYWKQKVNQRASTWTGIVSVKKEKARLKTFICGKLLIKKWRYFSQMRQHAP